MSDAALDELAALYPALKLLTGDAAYAQSEFNDGNEEVASGLSLSD